MTDLDKLIQLASADTISDELLAAYIDGNTTTEENKLIESFYQQEDLNSIKEISIDSKSFEELYHLHSNMHDFDIFGINDTHIDDENVFLNECNMNHFKQTIGDLEPFPGADTTSIQQHFDDTCAIQSQNIVMKAFGYDISEEQLVQEAKALNIYEEGSGTSPHDVGILLNVHGVPTHTVQNAHVYDLVNELAQGHKVIVGVDSGELWHPSIFEKMQDLFGGKADHALVVTGIDTTNPNHIEVIITDPGSGDVAMRYPMEQFLDAWHDSHCFMVATDIPAPAEYDPAMVNFDYEAGHLPFIGDIPFDVFSGTMLPEINQYFDANHILGNEDGHDDVFDHVFSAFSNYDIESGIDFIDLL